MEVVLIMLVFSVLIFSGFYVMNKIDKYRNEKKRREGMPMDEED